jgi:hypothetical protein
VGCRGATVSGARPGSYGRNAGCPLTSPSSPAASLTSSSAPGVLPTGTSTQAAVIEQKAFDLDYAEIAAILGKSPASTQ